ncbi:MAG TPA: PQQ-dependent sugar dehydrogenase [Halobacteriales archaeon]|nr:PQQ-dependent sugar dehydrogenase [Halobacteriales archaeon]
MAEKTVTRRRVLLAAGGVALAGTAGCVGSLGEDGGGGTGASTDGGTTTTPPAVDAGPLSLRTVATGFQAPVDLADPPGTDPYYVADQAGAIASVDPDGGVEPFLDLGDRVVTGGERGLLGIALHPDFGENRRLYVRYSSPRLAGTPTSFDHTFVLSEFRANEDGTSADPNSERRLLTIPEPQSNHNAGSIVFGPGGYLFVGVGDGGGGGDVGTGHAGDWYRENEGGNGQDVTDNLLGSILRIDVDGEERDRPYGIPDDNPLVGEVGLDEHWAWGFRNPWRLSFDGEDLYAGDVGQNAYEEVDLVRRGGNYGWNVKEGIHCYGTAPCPDETADGEPLIDPIIEYPHSGAPVSGISVIGGYVYRGNELPGLSGTYVFGDLVTDGRLFVAERPADEGETEETGGTDGGGLWPTGTLPIVDGDRGKLQQLLSFGRDGAGRLYALGRGDGGGGVYELRPGG